VVDEVWSVAERLGYGGTFIREPSGGLTDDHVPLQKVGIRAIDVIDFTFQWHHTPDDTIDKVSAASLQIVGDVGMGVIRLQKK
jgi:hypothetical protein